MQVSTQLPGLGAMERGARIHRRLGRISAAWVIAMAAVAVGGSPVVAECDGPPPSFRDALSTAKRIVIGDVTAVHGGGLAEVGADGRSSRFTLRIDLVLRGHAPSIMEIQDVVMQPCAGTVIARKGDRIAVAFDALDFTPPIRVNAFAWIRGTPPQGNGTVTEAEVLRRLGREAPDTWIGTLRPPVAPASAPPSSAPILVVLPGLFGLVLGWRRAGSRR